MNLEQIETEIGFLALSAKKFVENMKNTLNRKELESFLRAFKQFNRIIGEIFGLIKFLRTHLFNANDPEGPLMPLLLEVEELLREVSDLEEKFLQLMKD